MGSMIESKSEIILAKVNVATTPYTGETSTFHPMASIPIPAGLIGPNGSIIVDALWSYTNSANNKFMQMALTDGAVTVQFMPSSAVTTSNTLRTVVEIHNAGSEASQKAFGVVAATVFGSRAAALVTGNVNTALPTTLQIGGTLANAADAITLEAYTVRVRRA